jgi:hypothetical protein
MTTTTPRKILKKIEKPQWPGTADQAVRDMGGNVSPLARQALDAIYGTELQRQLNDLVDSTNKLIESTNELKASNDRQMQELREQTNAIAELEESMDATREESLQLHQECDVLIESQAQLLKMSKYL